MALGSFEIAFPLGVTVGKWTRVFEERHPDVELSVVRAHPDELRSLVASGHAQLAFVRLPIAADGLHLIPLYEEKVVAVLHHEHVLTLEKTLHLAELTDEPIVEPVADGEWDETVMRRIAAAEGVGILPQSVAKALRRRDVVAMAIEDAEPAPVALAWSRDADSPLIDEFIGIVRGRSAHSSRNPDVVAAQAADAKRRDAAKASAARNAAAAKKKAPAKAGAKRGKARATVHRKRRS